MDRKTLEAIRKDALSQRDWFREAANETGITMGVYQYRIGARDAYVYMIDLIYEMLESC